MRILHFAAENFAGVPGTLVRAERELGHDSLLMTLFPSAQGIADGELCLNLPFVRSAAVRRIKALLHPDSVRVGTRRRGGAAGYPPVWTPANGIQAALLRLRDRIWEPAIRHTLRRVRIEDVDILFLDGGLGFLRNDTIAAGLKARGKRIAVGYFGSDLRTRGILPEIDRLADFRFTVEFDHTLLYPGIAFVYFPFRLPGFHRPPAPPGGRIRIGHSPSNRAMKGTESILNGLRRLSRDFPVETVLIEGLPYAEALSVKSTCDLFVDQLGELGYGISGLEALAMGIPTAVQLMPDFDRFLAPHPFISVTGEELAERLAPFAASAELRRSRGEAGRAWVRERHDPVRVAKGLLDRLFIHPEACA
ncbi:glycosyltransferase [bacterium]|nr:glycosyltransferase [bacterium]